MQAPHGIAINIVLDIKVNNILLSLQWFIRLGHVLIENINQNLSYSVSCKMNDEMVGYWGQPFWLVAFRVYG